MNSQSFDEDVAGESPRRHLYGHAFPSAWQRETSAKQTVQDGIHLESLSGRGFPKSAVHEVNGKLNLGLPTQKMCTCHIFYHDGRYTGFLRHRVKSRGSTLHIDTLNLHGGRKKR